MAAVSLAEDFILERGGFGVIRLEDGTLMLTERTKRLLLAIADGVAEGLLKSGGFVAFDTVNTENYITPDGNARLAYHRASLATEGL